MYCRQCGIELRPDWKVCPNCGIRIENNLYQPIIQEQILLNTTGGVNPHPFGSWIFYTEFAVCVLTSFLIILYSFQINNERNRLYLLISSMVVIFLGVPALVLGRMKSLAKRRVDKGRLVITNLAVEGLAAEQHPNDIDIFINPVMTRIFIHEIEGAGPDVDGAFLIIKSKDKNYVFATPEAMKAGTIIMDLIHNNRNISVYR